MINLTYGSPLPKTTRNTSDDPCAACILTGLGGVLYVSPEAVLLYRSEGDRPEYSEELVPYLSWARRRQWMKSGSEPSAGTYAAIELPIVAAPILP